MGKRKVKGIAVHCTGASKSQSVESILRYWKEVLGWKNPGYHRIVEPNGNKHKLLHFDQISNGVAGHNSGLINICYIGGQYGDDRTDEQKAGLLDFIFEAIEYINDLEGLTDEEKIKAKKNDIIIQGHYQFPNVNKACPQFDAKKEYEWITS